MRIDGVGTDTTLSGRVSTLENNYVRTTRFASIGAGTSGTVTLPSLSTVVLDDFGGTVDAIVSTISSGKPTYASAVTASGTVIAATFDGSGNYTLSGTPSAYPVALIYRVRQKEVDFDSTSSDILGGGPDTAKANLEGGNNFTGAQSFGDGALSRFSATLSAQTGTTYTIQASDNGKVVTFSNAASIAVTVPNSLPTGFNCLLVQLGAGTVTLSAGSGATLNNRSTQYSLSGQYAMGTLIVLANSGGSAAIAYLGGDTV